VGRRNRAPPVALFFTSTSSGPAARWSAEETDACFIVRDANGQAIAYMYFEDEPGLCSRRGYLAQSDFRT